MSSSESRRERRGRRYDSVTDPSEQPSGLAEANKRLRDAMIGSGLMADGIASAEALTNEPDILAAANSAVKASALAYIRSPAYDQRVRQLVADHADTWIAEGLAEREAEFGARVRAIVAEQWESAVERAAAEVLRSALAAVRRGMQP